MVRHSIEEDIAITGVICGVTKKDGTWQADSQSIRQEKNDT